MDVQIVTVRNAPGGAGCTHVEVTATIDGKRTITRLYTRDDLGGEPGNPEDDVLTVLRSMLKTADVKTPAAAKQFLEGTTVKL